MVEQHQSIVAQSWLLYKQIAVPEPSPEGPKYRCHEMDRLEDGYRSRAVRWLSGATRFASRRVRRSAVGSARVPGKRAGTMSGKGRLIAKELFKHSGLPYWGMPSAKSE